MNNHSYNNVMEINKLKTLFDALADNTRLKILLSLTKGEKCVCMISEELNISHSLASHQLAYLKKHKLVKSRKDKRHCFYSLDDEHVKDILEIAFTHISEDKYD